jgi:hypothetical protein
MPKDYAPLLARSIFIKGRAPVGASGTPTSAPSTEPTSRPSESVVFNGVTQIGGETIAFLEDTSSGKLMQLKVGDSLAQGKIKSITLDWLDYESNGKVVRVLVGRGLDGEEAPPLTARASLSNEIVPTSEPSGGLSGGEGDVLQRLRQRRLQELGGR